jgi:hypothetical protein
LHGGTCIPRAAHAQSNICQGTASKWNVVCNWRIEIREFTWTVVGVVRRKMQLKDKKEGKSTVKTCYSFSVKSKYGSFSICESWTVGLGVLFIKRFPSFRNQKLFHKSAHHWSAHINYIKSLLKNDYRIHYSVSVNWWRVSDL